MSDINLTGREQIAASPMISLRQVSKSWRKGREQVEVLHNLSLTVRQGEMISIMGPSGTGKSTLLDLIAGVTCADEGEVKVAGHQLTGLKEAQRTRIRGRHIGFIFQFYCLIPVLNARQNVELPLGLWKMSKTERQARTQAALEIVGMAHRHTHRPDELSGGEQQRVAIARAIAGNPDILLCDEPTGDLNREMGKVVMDLLRHLCVENGKTIVVVTHDPEVARRADRHFRLQDGQLTEDDLPQPGRIAL